MVERNEPMSTVIAIANQKGGVAKTTTANIFGMGLQEKGYKVLLIDMDPQSNLSSSVGAEMYESNTAYELLKGQSSAEDTIQATPLIDIIPSNIMLGGAEQELTQTGKEYRLREMIAPIRDKYDFIIIDTPPMLGVLTINAFTAADEIIIPTTAGIFAANGIHQLNNTIDNVKKYCNKNLKIAGILLTRFNPRTNIGQDIKSLTKQLSDYIDAPFYKTFIRSSVVIEETQASKLNLFNYKKNATVAEDYSNFTDEYLKQKEEADKIEQ